MLVDALSVLPRMQPRHLEQQSQQVQQSQQAWSGQWRAQPPQGPPSPRSPPRQQGPPAHKMQPQQHQDYHAISSNWQVKRTPMAHYPPETQERIRSSLGRAGGRRRGAAQPAQHQQAAQGAELELLCRLMAWERANGCPNCVGSRSGEPAADFAAAALHRAAAAVQAWAQDEERAHHVAAERQAEAAARSCMEAAAALARYNGLEKGARESAAEAAEAAAAAALQALHQQDQAREQAQQAQQQTREQGQLQALRHQHIQQQFSQRAQRQQQLQRPSAAAVARPSIQQGVAADAPVPLAAAAPAQPPADLDADAAAAHEEETAEAGLKASAAAAAAAEASAAEAAAAGADGGPSIRRAVKPETLAFRQSFAEAAEAFQAAQARGSISALADGEQRTAEWRALRERRLTASAFSNALGFFEGDRTRLWEEKVGLRVPFAGNEATAWGTRAEPRALQAYQALTGQRVEGCMFSVKHEDAAHGWLGASPDGLIQGLAVHPPSCTAPAGAASAAAGAPGPPVSRVPPPGVAAGGAGRVAGEGAGILEIKCPFNKGSPHLARPPQHAIWYYMPQASGGLPIADCVHGLMEIFDRQWCNLYVWTPEGGSGLYHIERDREYWALCFEVLAEFWWNHVVPARQAAERGKGAAAVAAFRPEATHPLTQALRERSKALAVAAPACFFPKLSGSG
eukprot:scaffold9.g3016.t1